MTDIQMHHAHSFYWLKGRWIELLDPLLASKWIELLDPLLALPCTVELEWLVYSYGTEIVF